MVRITKELLKKRAEHNDGILSSLEEITLHQYNIEKIELLDTLCRHLKILYLQNNQIEKIENLKRLRELEYLNLALNNISKIENLSSCESLNKLDLTLNFVDIDEFESSIHSLKSNEHLSDLHLTGNPCTDYDRYRMFVIHCLPQLKRLDAIEIKKSERILARQQHTSILAEIREKAEQMKLSKVMEDTPTDDHTDTVEFEHSVRGRKAAFKRDKEREQKEEEEAQKKKEENPFKTPEDILKETRKKMNVVEKEGNDGQLPKQRNIGRYEFKMDGVDDIYQEKIRVIVEAPKYLDTSEMFVDIHPLWFQVIIKKKSLLLHLPTEVKVAECSVRRVMCNGWLELIMPKVEYKQRPKKQREDAKVETHGVGEKVETGDVDDIKVLDSDLDFDEDDVPPLE